MAFARFSSLGIDVRLVQPTSGRGTTAEAAAAVQQEVPHVVVCGGDGTVNNVIQSLVGTNTTLGVIPCGSGDDIAASLGCATGARAIQFAAQAILTGDRRLIDVGAVRAGDGTWRSFLGVLSTGFDSAVNERGNTLTAFGSQRYNVAVLRELASFVPAVYNVRLDDEVITGSAMMVAVGNGSRYGRGLRICPAAEVDDGWLDVTWVAAVPRRTLVRVFPSVFRGQHTRHPAVRTYRARSLTIAAPDQLAYADGERVGPLPVDVRVLPQALGVLAR